MTMMRTQLEEKEKALREFQSKEKVPVTTMQETVAELARVQSAMEGVSGQEVQPVMPPTSS